MYLCELSEYVHNNYFTASVVYSILFMVMNFLLISHDCVCMVGVYKYDFVKIYMQSIHIYSVTDVTGYINVVVECWSLALGVVIGTCGSYDGRQ